MKGDEYYNRLVLKSGHKLDYLTMTCRVHEDCFSCPFRDCIAQVSKTADEMLSSANKESRRRALAVDRLFVGDAEAKTLYGAVP